jgi:hypothetical protein
MFLLTKADFTFHSVKFETLYSNTHPIIMIASCISVRMEISHRKTNS